MEAFDPREVDWRVKFDCIDRHCLADVKAFQESARLALRNILNISCHYSTPLPLIQRHSTLSRPMLIGTSYVDKLLIKQDGEVHHTLSLVHHIPAAEIEINVFCLSCFVVQPFFSLKGANVPRIKPRWQIAQANFRLEDGLG